MTDDRSQMMSDILLGIQSGIGHTKGRVDRIERRLGLNEAEH